MSRYAVNDNASNAKKAIVESRLLCQYLCDCHTIQLCIEDAQKTENVAGTSMAGVMKKCAGIATLVKQSTVAREQVCSYFPT